MNCDFLANVDFERRFWVYGKGCIAWSLHRSRHTPIRTRGENALMKKPSDNDVSRFSVAPVGLARPLSPTQNVVGFLPPHWDKIPTTFI